MGKEGGKIPKKIISRLNTQIPKNNLHYIHNTKVEKEKKKTALFI
jgi:hypothetical protein